jgi:hypothetical protein
MILTAGLWHRAHAEFSHSGLDVPIALQLAGMLNGPIAVLAFPYYSLSHGNVRTWHLAILLLAVAMQWTYIGYRIDDGYVAPAVPSSRGYTVVGVLGALFGFGPLIAAFTTNVGLVYKAVALAWSLLMVFHFVGVLRNSRNAG